MRFEGLEFNNSYTNNDTMKNKKKLLVIDDNVEVIEALTFILSNEYELLTYQSYSDALTIINENILVVLLDIKMANIDGIEVFSLLKKINPNVQIIFHSAYPGNNSHAKILESLPHAGYLVKGEYDIKDLLKLIQNAFLDHVQK